MKKSGPEFISERISYVKDGNNLSLVITANHSKSKTRFLLGVLLLWLLGGGIIIFNFASLSGEQSKVMLLVWLGFWIYFLYIIGKAWRWNKFGNEIIKISDGTLKLKNDVRGRGWVHTFDAAKIKDLKEYGEGQPAWFKQFGGDYWSTDPDTLSFQCEDQLVAFGYQLTEKEKQDILRLLKHALPR